MFLINKKKSFRNKDVRFSYVMGKESARKELQISDRISPRIKNVAFHIHPECNKKINNQRRTHCEKGNINKIFPDGGCGNACFFSDRRTNAEHMPFNKMLKTIHNRHLIFRLK